LTELRQRRRNVNGAEFQNAYNRKQKRPTYWEAVECLVAGVRNPTHLRIQTGSQLSGHRHPQTIQKKIPLWKLNQAPMASALKLTEYAGSVMPRRAAGNRCV
jgi:hypothetical protein